MTTVNLPQNMTAILFPVLYSFRRCPYAMRARMALHYAGVQVEQREIALRQKPAALLAISPKGTVPVLQLTSGEVIDQSLDIMRWALRQSDPEGWLGVGASGEADRWIALNDGPFKTLLDRYKYADRHPETPMATHRSRALDALIHPLAGQLEHTPWLLGPRQSLADVALFPFVRQFARVDPVWFDALELPGLHSWLQAGLNSSLFAAVMHKQPVWVESPAAPG